MYLQDNNEVFPAANFANQLAAEDWLYWDNGKRGAGSLEAREIQHSPIAPYVGRFDTNLFRCPSDRFLPKLDHWADPWSNIEGKSVVSHGERNWPWQVFRFNYALSNGNLIPGRARGMASWIQPGGTISYFRASSIHGPSEKIMLAEKATVVETDQNAADLAIGFSSAWHWPPDQWPFDRLTRRHTKKGNLAFTDGHIETAKPKVSETRDRYDPSY
jgi:prepilin-type processing-associated H-X9-DG protein